MGCDLWIDQTQQDYQFILGSAGYTRYGQKITISNETVCKLGFFLSAYGSPTGTLYCRIRKVSNDSIIETSADTLDVSTLTGTPAWYYFEFNSLINEEVRLLVEFTGGDGSNYVIVYDIRSDVVSGLWTRYTGSYTDSASGHDATIKIYTIVTGEDHFKTVTEILGLSDTKTQVHGKYKSVSEILGLTDTKSSVHGKHKTVTEILGLKDTLARVKNIHRTISELLGLKDTVSKIPSYEVQYQEKPEQQVFINEVELTKDCVSTVVTRRENAIDDALLIANDEFGKTFLANAKLNDTVTIKYRYEDAPAPENEWETVFVGKITKLNPTLNMGGEICAVQCIADSSALKEMRVKDIYNGYNLRDLIVHMVNNYVEKIFGGVSSGWSFNTDYVWGTPVTINRMHFPIEPAFDSMKDLINLTAALRYPLSGVHWIVLPDGKLCLAPVGDHNVEGAEGCNVEDVWATYAMDDPLLVVNKMILQDFTTETSEANYIIVAGVWEYPENELWTEDVDYWSCSAGSLSEDAEDKKQGNLSIVYEVNGVGDCHCPIEGEHLNLEQLMYNAPVSVNFWIKRTNLSGGLSRVRLCTNELDYFYRDLPEGTADWEYLNFDDNWNIVGEPSWDNINHIYFTVSGTNAQVKIDGLCLRGTIGRVAYNSTLIAEDRCKMKFIKNSLAKTQFLDDTDTDELPLKALQELLRNMKSLMSGKIIIPLKSNIKAGQLIHVHAKYSVTEHGLGYFKINQDMRIVEVQHNFTTAGATTILTLVDDLMNSISIGPVDAYNAILDAVDPDFQTDDLKTLKVQDITAMLLLLTKDYA